MIASKPKRIYATRIISDHIMMQEDFERSPGRNDGANLARAFRGLTE